VSGAIVQPMVERQGKDTASVLMLQAQLVGQHVARVSVTVPASMVLEQAMLYPEGQIPGEKYWDIESRLRIGRGSSRAGPGRSMCRDLSRSCTSEALCC
jgi:hypothetical protein